MWDNRTEEQINSIKQKISDKYNNKTTSEKQLIKQHIKNGVQDKYNNFDEHTKNEIKLKQSLSHIELNKNRTKEQKQLISQHLSQSVKKYMNSRSEETIKTWKQKISISKSKSWQPGGSNRITWDNKSQEEIDSITKQVHETKKLNGSYGKSKDEDILYESLKNYCICSRQITLDKYSMDFELLFSDCLTYVELNGIYWHRDKPFENTEIDIATFNKLISKGGQYANIASKWRYTDVDKYNYCKDNNINFIRIYFQGSVIRDNIDKVIKLIYKYRNSGCTTILREDLLKFIGE